MDDEEFTQPGSEKNVGGDTGVDSKPMPVKEGSKATLVKETIDKLPAKDIFDDAQGAPVKYNGTSTVDEKSTNVMADGNAGDIADGPQEKPPMDNHTGKSENGQRKVKTCKPPLAICRLIVKRPKLAFAVTLCSHLSLLFLTIILAVGGYDILPTDFAVVPLDLTDDAYFLRGQAWLNRNSDPSILVRSEGQGQVQERIYTSEILQLFFEGDNVFTKQNLNAIKELENELQAIEKFNDFCQLTATKQCTMPQSIIRFFDGTFFTLDPVFFDPSFDNIGNVLNAANANPKLSESLQSFLGKDFKVDNTTNTASTSTTRSVFYFGSPLITTDDEDGEQFDKLQAFLVESFRDKLYDLVDSGYGGMEFVFLSSLLYSHDLNRQVTADLMLAGGSFAFIFIFMLIQTQSLFVTTFALLSVLTSFTGANLIYRIIFDYRYFGIFHVLSVFIILGIGADDIFVYYDTWRATGHTSYPSLEHRVSDCYRRASMAMFFTSLTTMCAFLANALSPLLAVASFGLFSGILVLVNYLSVITFFPCVVILYHLKWESWTWPCFRLCSNAFSDSKIHVSESKQELAEDERKPKRHNAVVRFCRGPYFKFITHKVARWCILAVFVAILTMFIYFATKLAPDEESVQIYKNDHNYQRAKDKQTNSFMPNSEDQVVTVYLIWGIKTQDRSMCHKTDFKNCLGQTVWDDSFDLNPKPAQVMLQQLCNKIRKMTDEENKELHIRRSTVSGELEISCFLDNMDNFLRSEANSTLYAAGTDLSLPATESTMTQVMVAHPEFYNTSSLSKYFYRYFEVGLSYWLWNGYSRSPTDDFSRFTGQLGEAMDAYDTVTIKVNTTEHHYGTRLKYVALVINTTLPQGNLGYESGLPVADAWERFIKEQTASLPPSLSGGFQCTPTETFNQWHWLKVQQTLAENAVQGIIVGICLAFPVLVLATENIILGLLATATIGCITVTVIGIIPLAGWKLGVLESLNLSLVVGLAVDYVVHLAAGYHLSKCKDRLGRVHEMLEEVGVSVMSGAFTTLGASLFMLFAKIMFFMQFGIFMFCTIGFSLLYSLGLFSTILALVGPENNFGSIVTVYGWIHRKSVGRKSTDVDCKACNGKGFYGPEAKP